MTGELTRSDVASEKAVRLADALKRETKHPESHMPRWQLFLVLIVAAATAAGLAIAFAEAAGR